ncbi:MAG: DUF2029 domain-containing protein [Chloroflexi bacterium]|nr:DUF2029 domain-containing protein [Chloroflexota bacterium]
MASTSDSPNRGQIPGTRRSPSTSQSLDDDRTTRMDRASLMAVTVIGLATAAVYLVAFTFQWPLWRLYTQPHLDYAFLSGYTQGGEARYLGSFALLFVLQYVGYRIVRTRPGAGPLDLILGGQVVFGLLNVWIYPVAALDVYDYLMYGRMVFLYGGNPFLQPPSAFPDPLVGFSPWPNERSVYGPVWQIVSLVPTGLSRGDLLAGLVAFKLTTLCFFVGCTLLIWQILRRTAPACAPSGALLFAWNPLLQFELVGNGHNDVVMVFFLLLAVLALVAERRLLVLPLLALAVLTKILVAILAPVFLAALLVGRGRAREKAIWVIGGGLIGLGLAVALYAPFWGGWDTFYFLSRGNWFTASIPTMLRELLRDWYPFEQAGWLAAAIAALGLVGYIAVRLGMWWHAERRGANSSSRWEPLLHAAHDITFFDLAFATLWWQPWYLVWLVALTALLRRRQLHERALLFCYGGTLNYVVFKYIWPVFQPMTYTTIMGISVVLIFGLPLLHLACSAGIPRLRARPAERVAAQG